MEKCLDILEEERKRDKYRQIKQNKLKQMMSDMAIQPAGRDMTSDSRNNWEVDETADSGELEENPLLIAEPVYKSNFASTIEKESNLEEELDKASKNIDQGNKKGKKPETFVEILRKRSRSKMQRLWKRINKRKWKEEP